MKKLLAVSALALAAVPLSAAAPPYDTPAKVAYLIDISSGAELFAKDALHLNDRGYALWRTLIRPFVH